MSVVDPQHHDDVAWPPAPHDPRERRTILWLGAWEVRLHDDRKFQYFIARGLWHLQLWHPERGISVLTPSRLTNGLYEVFPVDGWKARVGGYEALAGMLRRVHRVTPPEAASFAKIERALVHDVYASGEVLS